MTAELFRNINEWTEELLCSYTVKALKSACSKAGISWRNFWYKNRKAPYVSALIAHSQRVRNADALSLQPPLKKRKRGGEEWSAEKQETAVNENSMSVDAVDQDTDESTDTDDTDGSASKNSGEDGNNSEEDSSEEEEEDSSDCEAINAWTLAKERKCLQWFVDGPGCLKRKHSILPRVPFVYSLVEEYVEKYTRQREATMRAIRRAACSHFPEEIVNVIVDAASPKPVHSVEEALSRDKFDSFLERFEIDAFYAHDHDYGYGHDGSSQHTRLVDINSTYERLCMQYGFKSAIHRPQLWSRIVQDFKDKRCKESQCAECNVDILPRSNSQKWLLLQDKQYLHCSDCDCGVNWCAEFKMLVIECWVHQGDGHIRLRAANHGAFKMYQTEEGRIKSDQLAHTRKPCGILRWFAEFILITDSKYEWRFNQHRVLEKHATTKKTDCLEF